MNGERLLLDPSPLVSQVGRARSPRGVIACCEWHTSTGSGCHEPIADGPLPSPQATVDRRNLRPFGGGPGDGRSQPPISVDRRICAPWKPLASRATDVSRCSRDDLTSVRSSSCTSSPCVAGVSPRATLIVTHPVVLSTLESPWRSRAHAEDGPSHDRRSGHGLRPALRMLRSDGPPLANGRGLRPGKHLTPVD